METNLELVTKEELLKELNNRFSSFVIIFELDLPSNMDQLRRTTNIICGKCTPAHAIGLITFGSINIKQQLFNLMCDDEQD